IARGPAGDYLAALGDETAERAHVFVIDLERLVGAKAAYLTPSTGAPPTHPAAAALTATALAARPVASFRSFLVSHLDSLVTFPWRKFGCLDKPRRRRIFYLTSLSSHESWRSIDAATTSNAASGRGVFEPPFNALLGPTNLPITLTSRPGASSCFAASADSPVITIPSLSSSPGAPQSTVKRSTGVPAGVSRTSG